ncbi:MAG: hypothetical protein IJM15_00845 [Erysipelotrichaceae bacterium]|nr:hypothetical protein [Erysipelotrichaceae bacterium]
MKKYKQSTLLIIINVVISLGCGLLIGKTALDAGYEILGTYLLFFVSVILGLVLQTIIHEAGHLVFGLLTGYRFRSFRIFNIMLTVENGKPKFSKFSIAGTLGQCLMSSPLDRSKKPYFLYNLGGVIFNIISYLIFTIPAVFAVSPEIRLLCLGQIMFALINAFGNGIPNMMGGISTDGDNLLEMKRHPESIDCLYNMLDINDMMLDGKSMIEVPDELINTGEEVIHNGTLGSSGLVYLESKQLSRHDFEGMMETIKFVRDNNIPLNSIAEFSFILDSSYVQCLKGEFVPLDDKIFKKYLASTRTIPSTIRYNYVEALYNKDSAGAAKYLEEFKKVENTYPYSGELKNERELMALAERQINSTVQVPF